MCVLQICIIGHSFRNDMINSTSSFSGICICKYIRIKCLVKKLRIGQDDSVKHEKMDIYKTMTKDIKHN